MDRVDHQLVHCLQRDGRASFRRIAETLGVSEQTVARRFRRLEEDGALRVVTMSDARAEGLHEWFVRIHCRPHAAAALADALAARDDVAWVNITAGGGEIIATTRSDPRSAQGSVLLERLPRTQQVLSFAAYRVLHMHVGGDAEWAAFGEPLGAAQLERFLADGPDHPVTARSTDLLREEDAPLLAALARDGRAGVVALARATGWPPSRVAARVEELFVSGAVHTEVDLAVARFGVLAPAYVWLTVDAGELESVGRTLSRHPETAFAAAVTGTANLITTVSCRTDDELYAYVTTKVGALPGVRQTEVVPVLRRVKQSRTLERDGRLVAAPVPAATPVTAGVTRG